MTPELISAIQNKDGYQSPMTGHGTTAYDNRTSYVYGSPIMLDYGTLDALYESEGLTTRLIDIPVADMTREWITIEDDTDNLIQSHLELIGIKQAFEEALSWEDLYGGSIVVLYIDDGGKLEMPVNERRIRTITGMEVFDRYDVSFDTMDLYKKEEVGKEYHKIGKPKVYRIRNVSNDTDMVVHESRCLVFKGGLCSNRTRKQNSGWGVSVINRMYERLRGINVSFDDIEKIIKEFVIGTLRIENLQSLSANVEGRAQIIERLHMLDLSKGINNTVLLDKNEVFERVASNVGGLAELVKTLMVVLCSIRGIPMVKLFPEQSKGLGGEAEGNIRMYYDDIAAAQDRRMRANLVKVIRYLLLSSEFKGEREIEEADRMITFNPLWQPTDKEIAEARNLLAVSDEKYYAMGMPGEIIINNRFGGKKYSMDTKLPEVYEEYVKSDDASMNIPEPGTVTKTAKAEEVTKPK